MHTVFEEQVASLPPNTIALRDTEKTSWTYTQLNNVANLLAQHIRSVVPPTGEKVLVVLMPRSANYVMALVAAAKSGCAYCPIDVKVPKDRVQYIVKDSGASVLLTVREQRDLAASVIEPGVQIIFVDEFVDKIESVDAVVPNVPNVTNWMSPMYIIYTSGSTGRPKGVVVHHGAVVNTCSWFAKAHHVRVGDVSAQNLGAAFDPVTVEVWPYLISGANIIVMDENSKFGGAEATLAFIKKWAVTHITFPTALSTIIFDTAEFPPGLALRSWSCGGDKFKGTARPLTFSVVNAYGPTECCVLCSQYPLNFDLADAPRTAPTPPEAGRIATEPPLGYPTANTALYVLDEELKPVCRGQVGELCVGGAQVAIGYKNNDAATKKAFVPDPFALHSKYAYLDAETQKPRMYRTGDLVKIDDEYNLHFVGRRDFQVKIRGFRIELGEIESQLLADECVGNTAVVVRDSNVTGDKVLYAFITLHDKYKATDPRELKSALRSRLRSKLPDYMVPQIVIVAEMPLSANGKIDRANLPTPQEVATAVAAEGPAARAFVPPANDSERRLCNIWEEILHTKPIGRTDNWYDRGGSSLASTMLLSRMRQVFQMEITIQQFSLSPTVEALAKIVSEKGCASVAHNLDATLIQDSETLDPSITAQGLPAWDRDAAPKNVLITGVTGFLGAFLAAELLTSTNVTLYCLVRGKTAGEASKRIFDNLSKYGLLSSAEAQEQASLRIVPVIGDLAKPFFGLSEQQFAELCEVVDAIIHNGALVNFSYPYVSLKAANVDGTVTALKMATTTRLKPLHFVSTLSVAPSPECVGQPAGDGVKIEERYVTGLTKDIDGGYCQTKWVAEKLVVLAHSRGVPVTIFRPGRITGHSRTGECNHDDFLNLMMKGCIQMDCAPSLVMPCEMTPVDWCAKAIIYIALNCCAPPKRGDPTGVVFHIINDSAIAWNDLIALLQEIGGYRKLAMMPFKQWRTDKLLKLDNASHNALIPLVPMFQEDFEHHVDGRNTYSTINVHRAIEGASIPCPAVDRELLTVYLQYFIGKKFFPSPN